ncbi:MAG: phage tail tape measure protein [Bacteroidia bacterium]
MSNENLSYSISLKDLMSGKMRGIENDVGRLDSKMGRLNSTAGRLATGIGAYLSVRAIRDFGGAVVDSLTRYEYFSASLRTLLHGDMAAASLLNSQLVSLAQVSPFSLVDVQDSSKRLLAYGFSAKQIIPTMKMLGDVSSATGNAIGDVTYLFGTLRTQGIAMTKDLREFTNRGINLIPLLAKHFNIAEKDVYSFASAGKIGFKEVEEAFKTMTSEGGDFFNMMETQNKTTGGKISNLGDAWEQLKITIGQSQAGILNSTVSWATSMVSVINQIWKANDKVHSSFEKYGAQDYTMLEKFNKFIGVGAFGSTGDAMTGGQIGDTKYRDSLNKQFVNPSADNFTQAAKSQLSLTNIISNMWKDKKAQENPTTFNRTMAIVKGALDDVRTNIAALKSSAFNTTPVSISGEDDVSGRGRKNKIGKSGGYTSEISGQRPQNIYITIGKQVETLNITAQTFKEGVSKGVDLLKQALLETVNDANEIGR